MNSSRFSATTNSGLGLSPIAPNSMGQMPIPTAPTLSEIVMDEVERALGRPSFVVTPLPEAVVFPPHPQIERRTKDDGHLDCKDDCFCLWFCTKEDVGRCCTIGTRLCQLGGEVVKLPFTFLKMAGKCCCCICECLSECE